MSHMFSSAFAFNQDIGGWNTSNVTDMSRMFVDDGVFNQNIGSWDTHNVTSMNTMFRFASAFDQNLGSWNISNLTDATDMFDASGMSQANMDATLDGWAAQALAGNVQSGVRWDITTFTHDAQHLADVAALQAYGWQIYENGTLLP